MRREDHFPLAPIPVNVQTSDGYQSTYIQRKRAVRVLLECFLIHSQINNLA